MLENILLKFLAFLRDQAEIATLPDGKLAPLFSSIPFTPFLASPGITPIFTEILAQSLLLKLPYNMPLPGGAGVPVCTFLELENPHL